MQWMINRSRKIVMGSAMDLYCGRSTLHKLEAAQATHGKPFIQASDQGPKNAVLVSRGAAATEARVANFANLSGRSPNWCRDDGGGAVSSGADVDYWRIWPCIACLH